MISSTANPQLKHLMKLQEKGSLRKEEGVFVCEGKKMFQEILQYGRESLVKAYFSESYRREAEKEGILEQIDYETVTDSVFREASQTVTPQGVLAIVKQPSYTLEQMLSGEQFRLLLLENLRDPGNLGTILRTAEGAGMNGVVLNRESVDIFNPKVIRSTMGAIYRVPFLYTEDFNQLLKQLKHRGVTLYAAHLAGSVEYDEPDYPAKTAILIGNEAKGLTEEAANLADARIRIPMEGKLESLNAGVAAAIVMYETKRQLKRSAAPGIL